MKVKSHHKYNSSSWFGLDRRTSVVMADGVVATMVPKLELEGGASEGLAQDLVAHADAKHGLHPQKLLHILYSVGKGRGITLHKPRSR